MRKDKDGRQAYIYIYIAYVMMENAGFNLTLKVRVDGRNNY